MRVVWTRSALSDLEDIQDYVAKDSPAAAYRLAVDLYERPTQVLADTPMIGRVGRARGTREFVFNDLPYVVAYRVTDKVEILALVHSARDWPETFD
jgi:addiction module RelE/StbE family toxin